VHFLLARIKVHFSLQNFDPSDFEPAYNLLISLILSSKAPETYLSQVISNLSTPPAALNGPSLAITVLATLFNVIPEYPSLRYQIFKAILNISRENNMYDYVSPYFKGVNEWLEEWKVPEEERTQIWAIVISMAEKAGDRYISCVILLIEVTSTTS
jgi:translation initiation factor 3 subunit M